MTPAVGCVLVLNGGSSSIRFAVYAAGKTPRLKLGGKIDRLGSRGANLVINQTAGMAVAPRRLHARDGRKPVSFLLKWLEAQPVFASIRAVGHRVVHGMKHSRPERVTPKLLAELRRITPYDPEHLPREIALIEAVGQRHPKLPQVACFDTAFHQTMPGVARLLPIPRRYAAKGVQRYGFHGLSYSYLLEELGRLDPAAAKGRVILAHLGNGASLAAVRDGQSIDTSMGFTPASGLVMSTRSGDLDPGLLSFLARSERMSAAQFSRMVNHESGMLGISDTSSDMRDLCARESTDIRAAEAVALFCYQAKKWLGAYAAALGGLDTLVFAGGIGENAPLIRKRICDGLEFLGIELNRKRNAKNASLISTAAGPIAVRVIRTDEELMNRTVGHPPPRLWCAGPHPRVTEAGMTSRVAHLPHQPAGTAAMLNALPQDAFGSFPRESDSTNGRVADKTQPHAPASIAAAIRPPPWARSDSPHQAVSFASLRSS